MQDATDKLKEQKQFQKDQTNMRKEQSRNRLRQATQCTLELYPNSVFGQSGKPVPEPSVWKYSFAKGNKSTLADLPFKPLALVRIFDLE